MRFKVGIFLIIALFIAIILGFYIFASAQEVQRVEIKVDDGKDVIFMESTPLPGNDASPRQRVFIGTEGGKTVIIDNEKSRDNENNPKKVSDIRSDKEESGNIRKDKQEQKKQEGFSKDNINNPETKNKVNDKRQGVNKSQPTEAKQDNQNQPSGQKVNPSGDQLGKYLSIIAEKNLFMSLGSTKKEQKAAYAVTAIISNTSEKNEPKAIIEQTGSNKSYYVSEGDTLADNTKINDIAENEVKLNRSGEDITLKLGVGTQGGFRGGGGEGFRGRGEGSKGPQSADNIKRSFRPEEQKVGGEPNLDNLPPFVLKMLEERGISIDELKNNPDLREKLRQEFQQRFGGGGGGRQRMGQ